jgi:hypothetical protein
MLCFVRSGLPSNIYQCGVDAITGMVVAMKIQEAVEEVIDIVITFTRGMHSVCLRSSNLALLFSSLS